MILQVMEMCMLRLTVGVTKLDKVSNEHIGGCLGMREVGQKNRKEGCAD